MRKLDEFEFAWIRSDTLKLLESSPAESSAWWTVHNNLTLYICLVRASPALYGESQSWRTLTRVADSATLSGPGRRPKLESKPGNSDFCRTEPQDPKACHLISLEPARLRLGGFPLGYIP